MLRTGVDLVSISRLAGQLAESGDPFLRAAWTEDEVAHCRGEVPRLAVRWAAKEATLKALGVGVDSVPLRDVEVRILPSGAPTLHLNGAAEAVSRELGLAHWSVSLSHEGDLAIAQVVALADRATKTSRRRA